MAIAPRFSRRWKPPGSFVRVLVRCIATTLSPPLLQHVVNGMYCVGVVTNVESYLQPVQEGALLGSHFVYDAPSIRLPLDEKNCLCNQYRRLPFAVRGQSWQ